MLRKMCFLPKKKSMTQYALDLRKTLVTFLCQYRNKIPIPQTSGNKMSLERTRYPTSNCIAYLGLWDSYHIIYSFMTKTRILF